MYDFKEVVSTLKCFNTDDYMSILTDLINELNNLINDEEESPFSDIDTKSFW